MVRNRNFGSKEGRKVCYETQLSKHYNRGVPLVRNSRKESLGLAVVNYYGHTHLIHLFLLLLGENGLSGTEILKKIASVLLKAYSGERISCEALHAVHCDGKYCRYRKICFNSCALHGGSSYDTACQRRKSCDDKLLFDEYGAYEVS